MPADEVREDPAGGSRARTGPRHAAPKKPLFNRFHVPAGKAMALAAMPTAVLMGMGLTPTLAQAKPQPKNPFQDGPCVTQPDEASKDQDKGATSGDETGSDKAGDKPKTDEPTPGESGSPADTEPADGQDGTDPLKDLKEAADKARKAADEAAARAKELVEKATKPAEGAEDSAEPTPAPSESEESDDFNPWDPLGLGKALEDLFTPDEPEQDPSPDPSGTPSEETPEGADKEAVEAARKALADAKTKKGAATKAEKAYEDAKAAAEDGAKDGAGKAKDTADEAADKAGDAADKAKDAVEPGASGDPMAPDENGKKPFPCPEEKKVAGDDGNTPVQIPNQPWFLEASSLTLKGADYQGIVNLTMPNGKTKQVMKYVISNGVDIGDLHQIVDTPEGGYKTHVKGGPGTTSTIRGGAVTMYTESLSGNLFGLIPVTFDPEHPPPLNIPLIYFTHVKVTQAAQFGGNLHIPGLSTTVVK